MKILISGAGVAGLSAAVNLGSRGHSLTVVERSGHFRVNGSPVDVRGDAIDIAARMGLLEKIRADSVTMTAQGAFVDAAGAVLAPLPVAETQDSGGDIEIAREDLANILVAALPQDATILFRDSVDTLDDDCSGVDVRLASGRTGRYDVVIGADGLHSAVRRLTFGPESAFSRHLGAYCAIATLPDGLLEGMLCDRVNPTYNYSGRMASVMRFKDTSLAVFLFRSAPIAYDHHDVAEQKSILREAFAGHSEWLLPQLLDAADADPDIYFDSASQIHMPIWHRGRVVLVGDAAHAASGLSGRGTSLALTGSWLLAEELERGDDGGGPEAAFARYEERQRPYVEAGQASVGAGADLVVPATQEEIDVRNARIGGPAGRHRPRGRG